MARLQQQAASTVIQLLFLLFARYLPRFFDQVGRQIAYASIGNKHFLLNHVIKNYEQSQHKLGLILENKVL